MRGQLPKLEVVAKAKAGGGKYETEPFPDGCAPKRVNIGDLMRFESGLKKEWIKSADPGS